VAPSDPTPADAVTVYWRPGCPYCARLRRGLRRAGLAVNEVDIWSDALAAASVRDLAGGNETVPTVVVGATALVNPSAAEVVDAVRRAGIPVDGPAPSPPRWPFRWSGSALATLQWVTVAALLVASLSVDGAGHTGVSWALDGAAVAVYLVVGTLRRRLAGG
jgi:mycoredoxin